MSETVLLIALNKEGEFLMTQREGEVEWSLLGTTVDEGETAEEALERGIKDEIHVNIALYLRFKRYLLGENTEHVYFMILEVDLLLTFCEQGRLDYFSKDEIEDIDIGPRSREILNDFLNRFPDFRDMTRNS